MAPPVRDRTMYRHHLCFLLLASTATLSAAVTASSYSTACPSLTPAQDRHTDGDEAVALIRSFQISGGQFSGGADGLFSPDDDPYKARQFHFLPHGASRTDDPALVHLTGTLTIFGPRSWHRGNHHYYSEAASIAFILDGYHSSASRELCMVGTGTEHAADGSLRQYHDVVLRLHVPSPPSLADPFVSGSMEGSSDLGTISLLAYTEGDHYNGSLRALGAVNSVCAHLKEQLMISYRLEHGRAVFPRMRVNQMQCSADGAALHAYAVLFNDTRPTERGYRRRRFLVGDEALVADGHWDQARRMLCLRACRVTLRAPASAPAVDCTIGMSFWFPAVWTMREQRAVAGMLWNSSQAGAEPMPIIDDQRSNANISDVKYSYNDTMLEEAKKHHQEISNGKKIIGSDSFPDFNSTNGDAEFSFQALDIRGQAYPVTIGSGVAPHNILADDDASSRRWVVYGSMPTTAAARRAVVDDMKEDLLNVSYVIRYSAPRDKMRVRPSNVAHYSNYSVEKRKILAEGIYDRKRGILCMVGCQERAGLTDCQTLILHTKRNPEAAPAVSVTMLVVLTMGFLAPLVLNSEALFASGRSQYYELHPTSRRIEINEVMMRAPTLIAFVLQLRLLQLAWSGRRTSTMSERTVLWICLPLYALGGIVAAVFHVINARASTIGMAGWRVTIWQDLVSYAGLILDGFLLPQIILNASLGGSRAWAISPWFYLGGTMLRLMPHVYDVVRARIYKPSMRSSKLYASPHDDLFSVAWDMVIPCGAALLALLLFLQQRLPGTAPLPSQRRRSSGYEMVSNI
uniref:RING-type E3 ubiquitin transferase n=1 Tax=Aegilops tauschii TaxID=37682 RepID=M8C1R4_AEGTA